MQKMKIPSEQQLNQSACENYEIFKDNQMENEYHCEFCGKKFLHKMSLIRHKEAVHEGIRYKCELCPKSFSQSSELKLHNKCVHKGQGHRCDLCNKIFTRSSDLKIHLKSRNHKEKIMQKEHSKTYGLKNISICIKKVLHICNNCDKYFHSMKDLQSHVKSAHFVCKEIVQDPIKPRQNFNLESINNNPELDNDENSENLMQKRYKIKKNDNVECGILNSNLHYDEQILHKTNVHESSKKKTLRHNVLKTRENNQIEDALNEIKIDIHKKVVEKSNFASYQALIVKDKKEICDICKKEFNSASDMLIHTSLEHLAETVQFAKKYIL